MALRGPRFFFSSRRRHTRFDCDWSSDVCSSDLVRVFRVDNPHTKPLPFWEWLIEEVRRDYPDVIFLSEAFTRRVKRSEERRVGKECRARCPAHVSRRTAATGGRWPWTVERPAGA